MVTLTPEQRAEIEKLGENVRAIDPDSGKTYVLVSEEQYAWISALLEPNDDFRVRDAYPLIDKVAGKAGWDDPEMDVYNDLDPRRPS